MFLRPLIFDVRAQRDMGAANAVPRCAENGVCWAVWGWISALRGSIFSLSGLNESRAFLDWCEFRMELPRATGAGL